MDVFQPLLIFPVIPDVSTEVAALRTGALDWSSELPLLYADTLATTSPDLIQARYLPGQGYMLGLMVQQEPWNNRNVRRALMIGTDWEAILQAVTTDGEIHVFPLGSHTPYYTPMDELPESAQVLYLNDTALAKQMLIDEGLGDGFKIKIHVASGMLDNEDTVMMLKEMWDDFGVEVEPVVQEWGAISGPFGAGTLEDSWAAVMANAQPYIVFNVFTDPVGKAWFWSGYDNPVFSEMHRTMVKTSDVAERTQLTKDMAIYFLEECAYIPFPTRYVLNCYWPWVKNYYGELESGYYNWQAIQSLIWIDQDLKAELGF